MQKKWGIRRIAESLGLKKKEVVIVRHSCKTTLKKVMLALDNEMTIEEEKKFLAEINTCSYCLEKYHIEQTFKKYLCDKVKRHPGSPQLADQIRNHIHNFIDRS